MFIPRPPRLPYGSIFLAAYVCVKGLCKYRENKIKKVVAKMADGMKQAAESKKTE